MPTWLTAAEIARRLGRPVSTVRSWRDRYRSFVPERLDGQGRQTYPLEILAEIEALQHEHLTPREISAELARRHGGTDEGAAVAPTALAEILGELRQIHELLDWLVAREKARQD